jgi:hypothetical protein
MGFAVAAAARPGRHRDLVAAPTELPTPAGVTRVDVTTALEMHATRCSTSSTAPTWSSRRRRWPTSARPKRRRRSSRRSDGVPTLELTRNPDILAELGCPGRWPTPAAGRVRRRDRRRGGQGRAKLAPQGRGPAGGQRRVGDRRRVRVDTNRVVILDRDGGRWEVPAGRQARGRRTHPRRVWSRGAPRCPQPRSTPGVTTRSTPGVATVHARRPIVARRGESRTRASLRAGRLDPTAPYEEPPCPDAACSPPSP